MKNLSERGLELRQDGSEMGSYEQVMFEVFQDLLDKWTSIPCSNIGATVEWPTNLPLEKMVLFTGEKEGCLVLRGPERLLGIFLDEIITRDEDSSLHFEGDVMGEFARLFFCKLAEVLWQIDAESQRVYLARTSDPSTWPSAKPEAALTVLVRNLPVEIRLWTWQKSAGKK